MNGARCITGGAHVIEPKDVRAPDDPDEQVTICSVCRHPLHRWWWDGDEDRTGRWSAWESRTLVIEELP